MSVGLTATEIGRRIGASPETVNHLLLDAGLTDGTPGAYRVTEKGAAFGAGIDRDNGHGGVAWRDWGWNSWNEAVIDQLDTAPEKIAEVAAALKAKKSAKRAADKLEAEEYWAGKLGGTAGSAEEDSSDDKLTDGQKAAVALAATVIVVVGGVLIYQAVERRAKKKSERANGRATPLRVSR